MNQNRADQSDLSIKQAVYPFQSIMLSVISFAIKAILSVIYFKSSTNLCLAQTLILFCSQLGSLTSRPIVLSNDNKVVYIKTLNMKYSVFSKDQYLQS